YFRVFGFDLAQSDFVDSRMRSREVRFESVRGRPVAWTVGVFDATTERYLSRGDLVDLGLGIFPGFREPSSSFRSPQLDFTADSQEVNLRSAYAGVDFSGRDKLELSVS